jgi:AcrR family transcriptional regulator
MYNYGSEVSTPRQTHRDALLDAAKRLLRERDYGNITARDLVAASKTNLGSIGYHFGSKDALLNEAIGQALEEWTEAIGRATPDDASGTPMERMRNTWRAVLDEFEQVRPYFLAFIEALARSAHSPELAERLAAHYERQRERVAGMLGEELDPDVARRIATLVIATTDGLLLQSFVDPDNRPKALELVTATGKAFAGS